MENRKVIQDVMVERMIEDMSSRDMMEIVARDLTATLDEWTDEELLAEVQENFPDLLEEN